MVVFFGVDFFWLLPAGGGGGGGGGALKNVSVRLRRRQLDVEDRPDE